MSTLSGILNAGRQALIVEQLAMQVIGNNTANVNTEGYSRRRLDLTTSPAVLRSGSWFLGSGVSVGDLGRVRDTILDQQYRNTKTDLGYWSQLDESLNGVEQVFNEFGGSAVSDHLQDYWNAWQDLANDPENTSSRTNLVNSAQTLAASLRRTHQGLVTKRSELDQQLVREVREVNQITEEIAVLNVEIVNLEASSGEASDLRDRRDLLLDRLSEYVPITSHENDDGAVNVYLGGQILVQVEHAEALSVIALADDDQTLHHVSWASNSQSVNLGMGKLGATLTARDENIPEAIAKLNTFTTSLVSEVNSRHVTGYGLSGSNGFDFWDATISSAGDIAVDAAIVADAGLIATSSSAGSPGDNSIALLIGQLQSERVLENGTASLSEFYSNFISDIGSQGSAALERRTTEEATMNLLEERRQSVSGVSMDEEMANLIKVQKSYEAAAKLVTTIDEMMQTVIEMI
jgi:flagellar hook-associated protein 1 FlgK